MHFTPIRCIAVALSLAGTGLLLPAFAPAQPSPQPVFDLVNERLREMRGVALYKAQHGLPVADEAREAVVLRKAEESAAAAGLDPRTVAAFYRLQIQAAKAIQYRYLAGWSFEPDVARWPAEDLVSQIRPRLIELGDALTSAIGAFLSAQACFRPDQLQLFLDSISVEHLSEAEGLRIFESMSQIDLLPPHDHCTVPATVSPADSATPGA